MTSYETAIMVSVIFCGLAAIVLSVASIIKIHNRSYSGFLLAGQVFLYQLVTLMGVMQKSWIFVGVGILCASMLALNIILRFWGKAA